ncbi:MAG: hypothetical protein ACXVJ7_00545 [Acidimicrobiia bacterium]
MRKPLVVALLVSLVATSCRVLLTPDPPGPPSRDGFVAADYWRARQDSYLDFASTQFAAGSFNNLIANAEHARRTGTRFDTAAITMADFQPAFDRMDDFSDTADFNLTYLMNLWYGYRDLLPADVRAATEAHFTSFKYWYTDPQPAGTIDQRYYWSENHRLLFHADEYLAGQAFPNDVFSSDGNTGAWHEERARDFIDKWLTEKARYGFTEWHSDVYYQKTFDALITVVEWVDDPVLARRASMVLDLLLFDIALHIQKGNNGVTHGRSYMKDKSQATDQDVYNLAKVIWDDTSLPYTEKGDPGATLISRAHKYRLPAVILRVGQSKHTTVDQEHMGLGLDPSAPVDTTQTGIDGHSFSDPAEIEFFWEKGLQTAWQVVPLTLDTLDATGLWESDFFKPFKPIADITGGDRDVARSLSQQLEPMLGFAFLLGVDTYTYRSDSVMLSTAQSYRPGRAGEQTQVSQATLDENAIVFTTHPKNEPQSGTQWPDDDGYWTGNGTLPRAAQHGALSMSLYTPAFANPGPPLTAFRYLDYTHAYFPQERFDEVVQQDGWTFGRKGDGYVALWSWRPTQWRTYSDPGIYTHGLTQPFDLVAPGGPDDVWLTQVGDAATFGDFASFRARVLGGAISVTPRPAAGDLPGGFDVSYDSPTEGTVQFGTTGPLTVKGTEVPLASGKRYDNPWASADVGAQQITIADTAGSVKLDFARSTREVSATRPSEGHPDHGHGHGNGHGHHDHGHSPKG